MKTERFRSITDKYSKLRIAIVGDFCLDRYLEIDPSLQELSLETGLPVYNVAKVRAQPGGAGTILNNIVALGIGTVYPVGFCGDDGEGFELQRALSGMTNVKPDYFFPTPLRKTFTYCKPLIMEEGRPPRELNRFDAKNWTATPGQVEDRLVSAIQTMASDIDAIAVLDQVDHANTGVITTGVLEALHSAIRMRPEIVIVADSRRTLKGFPPFSYKMNRLELAGLSGKKESLDIEKIKGMAVNLAKANRRNVFVTLSEEGILGATPAGEAVHVPCHPLKGEIDIVGAGDSVTANLCAAMAAGADLKESLEIANAAASVVVHKLGTTGTASVEEIRGLLV